MAAPENTLLSFKRAIDVGVDWIEFDLRESKDGVLVVIHDETVDRTTDGKGKVSDMTFERASTARRRERPEDTLAAAGHRPSPG